MVNFFYFSARDKTKQEQIRAQFQDPLVSKLFDTFFIVSRGSNQLYLLHLICLPMAGVICFPVSWCLTMGTHTQRVCHFHQYGFHQTQKYCPVPNTNISELPCIIIMITYSDSP